MENKEKNDTNWLSIILISASALFLLFAVFYNIGRAWGDSSSKGNNNIEVKNANRNSYDFWKVTYHDVDFDNLNKVK